MTTSKINWKPIVESISTQQGEERTVGVNFYENNSGEFNEVIELWKGANYTSEKVEWINFYPGTHFDDNIPDVFSEEVNATHIRSWISCIRPGKSAPWHQDVDDQMNQYLKLGSLVRYTCHISEPSQGQLLLIEKDSFYMVPQGTITRWSNIMNWHGSSNCGFKNHYLYHFLGYENI